MYCLLMPLNEELWDPFWNLFFDVMSLQGNMKAIEHTVNDRFILRIMASGNNYLQCSC
jgi:hypothetical protein